MKYLRIGENLKHFRIGGEIKPVGHKMQALRIRREIHYNNHNCFITNILL